MMNHEHIREQVSLLLDQELPDDAQRALLLHLAECRECRSFFRSVNTVRAALQRRRVDIVPSELDRRFGILAMHERSIARSVQQFPQWMMSVGIALFMVLGVYLIGNFRQEELLEHYRRSLPAAVIPAAEQFSTGLQ